MEYLAYYDSNCRVLFKIFVSLLKQALFNYCIEIIFVVRTVHSAVIDVFSRCVRNINIRNAKQSYTFLVLGVAHRTL